MPEIYGDEFCVYNPPDPSVTGHSSGARVPDPHAYPVGLCRLTPLAFNT